MIKVDYNLLEEITELTSSDWSASDYIYPPVVAWDKFRGKTFNYRFSSDSNFYIYIHLPFCKTRCTFCRYYSKPVVRASLYKKYTDLIIQEIKIWARKINIPKEKIKLKSIYFGGGTPTLFDLNKIFDEIIKHFPLNYLEQVNIETTPESLDTLNKILFLKKHGLNAISRIMIGAQSLDTKVLKAINRSQSQKKDIKKAFYLCKNARIKTIGVDMIVGLPKQTEESLLKDVKFLIKLKPQVIHLYGLVKSPTTALSGKEFFIIKKLEPIMKKAKKILIRSHYKSNRYTEFDTEWLYKGNEKFQNKQIFLIPNEPQKLNCKICIGPSAMGYITFPNGEKKIPKRVMFINTWNFDEYEKKICGGKLAIDKYYKFNTPEDEKRSYIIRNLKNDTLDYGLYKKKFGTSILCDFSEELMLVKKHFEGREECVESNSKLAFSSNSKRERMVLARLFYSSKIFNRCMDILETENF